MANIFFQGVIRVKQLFCNQASKCLNKRSLLVLPLLVAPTIVWATLGASISAPTGAIFPSEIKILTITLSNGNPVANITGANFVNSLPGLLPNGLKIAGAPTTNCAGGTVVAPLSGQSISFSGGTIPRQVGGVDGTCTITIPVTAGTSTGNSTSYTYTVASGTVTGNDGAPVANAGTVNQSINVNTLTKPSIGKSFSPDSTLVLGGAARTMTIVLNNTNSVAIAGFNVNDVFPTNAGGAVMQVATPVVQTATCSAGPNPTFSPAPAAVSVSATGTIPANGSCTLTVSVVARQTNGQSSTSDTNTINKDTQFTNSIGIGAAADATAPVIVQSPLRISKSPNAAVFASGQPGFFDIVLNNDGNSALPLAFTDSPIDGVGNPAYGLKVTSTTNSCGGTVTTNGAATGITLAGGSLPVGGTCTIRINFVGTLQAPNTPIGFTNTIPQGAVTTSPGVVSPAVSASISLRDVLNVYKNMPSSNIAAGSAARYDVTIENWSNAPLAPVTFPDTFDQGQTFLTGIINGVDYTPSVNGGGCASVSTPAALNATSAAFTIPSVNPRTNAASPAFCIVSYWLQVPANLPPGTTITNSIAAGSVCVNGGAIGSANCFANPVGTSGNVVKPITLAKSFNPTGPLQEGVVTKLTLLVTNGSVNPITNLAMTDNLQLAGGVGPGQLRIATPANAATTCGGSPVITALPGSTSITLNGGSVAGRAGAIGANATCAITVDVAGPAGSYNNLANISGNETPANGSAITPVSDTSNTANIVYNPALTAGKSFSPTSVAQGGKSTVIVRLGNLGNVPITNATVTDPLPAGMTVANPANASTTCAGPTNFTVVPGASSAAITGATIAAAGTCDFLFDVVATGPTNWANNIPAGNITADGGITNQTPVTATLVRNPQPKVTVSKSLTPSTIAAPGQTSVLEIDIANTEPGAQLVTGINVTDYYTVNGTSGAALNGMANETSPSPSTDCTGGIVSADPDGDSVTLTGGTLAAGATCKIFVSVTSVQVGGITNFIPIGGITTTQGVSNVDAASSSLATNGNVSVNKQFTPNVVKPGDSSRLRITFYNPVAQQGTNLTLTDTLPAGVVISGTPSPSTTCVGGTVTTPAANQVRITGAQLAPASASTPGTCYMEVNVSVAAAGDYVNTIPARGLSMTQGGSTVNNNDPTSDTLHVRNPLVIHKAIDGKTDDLGNPVGFSTGLAARTAGAPATMTIRIDNPNTISLTQASFTDTMPTGLSVAITPNASTTCVGGTVTAAVSSQTVTLSGATIPANGFCTLTVDVLSNIQGLHTNEIPAGAISTFEGVSNSTKTDATLEIVVPPTILKNFTPPLIQSGGVSVLTLTFGNPNTSTATLTANMVDTLPTVPGNMVVAPAPGIATTCSSGVASVTAVAGAGTVTFNTGGTIQSGGCTISVNVTTIANGTYNNTIPAGALQTNFGNNPNPTTAPLTISSAGYISGKIFKDNNVTPDGVFNGTDAPIANVVVELRDNTTNALIQTTTTDALGNYTFVGLPAGSYRVVEPTQPAGTINGITTAGTAGGTATGVAVTPSTISAITLTTGGGGVISNSTGNNFAEVVTSSLSGNVFLDKNNDGIKNGTDTVLVGVTIELLNAAGTVVTTTITDAFGNYSFTGLAPGQYSIREPSQPAGTANGITTAGAVPNGGTLGTVTATTVTPSVIGAATKITLPPNTTSTGNNFAEIPSTRSISGRVFLDIDENGSFNGTDSGIPTSGGQVIQLTGTDVNGNPVSLTTTVAADGTYSFTGLPEGTYTLTQNYQPANTLNGLTTAGSAGGTASNPTATSSTIVGIDLTGSNKVSVSNDFPENPLTVSGNVFNDTNGLLGSPLNTVDGAGTRAGSTTLTAYLVSGGNVVLSSPVAADGTYRFVGVAPGTYSVVLSNIATTAVGSAPTVSLPTGWINTGENNSAAAGSDGSVNGTSATFSVVASNVTNINFGIEQPPVAGDAVYPIQPNPGGTINVAVGAGAFTGVLPPGVSGTNATDTAAVTQIRIATFPTNATSFTINGTTYTLGTWPVGGLTLTPAQLIANPISVDPITGATNVVISYTATDAAGLVSGTGTVTLPFTQLTLSGNVFHDVNGNKIQNNPAENAATKPVPAGLNAVLTDLAGVVIAVVPVNPATGTYSFPVNPSTSYGVVLTTANPAIGSSNPPVVRPSGWVTTGENLGGVIDATPDSKQTAIAVALTDVANVNFGIAQEASLSGIVWRDANHDRAYTAGEVLVPSITVEVLNAAGTVVGTATTDATGAYTVGGLTPGVPYKVRFRDNATSGIVLGVPTYNDQTANTQPGTIVTNTAGATSQIDATGANLDVVLIAGNNLSNQSLPLDPSGVIYDSIRRIPIAGATVTLLGPGGVPVLGTCLVGGINTQVTGANGIYQYLLLNPAPAGCPGTGAYTISVVQPAGYLPPNAILGGVTVPAGTLTPPLGAGVFAVQGQSTQPTGAQPTTYYFNINLTLTGVVGTSSQGVVDNHIPLDPITQNAFIVSKTGNKAIVEIGDTILYTVRAKFLQGLSASTFDLIDNLPAGFRYIPGTATQENGSGASTPLADPAGSPGPQLTFKPLFGVQVTDATITYKVRISVGAMQGDGINRVRGSVFGGSVTSNTAQFKVKVTGGVFTNDACLAGKIFVDCNNNHIQDNEELGIPGVRFYMEDGTYLISDVEGKYSYCGISPRTHVFKADNATLPRGSRLTITSNRNAGDANSLFLDVKNGELIRADFAEGSCSNTVLEQVKSRRTGGEVRAPETERKQGPALKFEGKSPSYPQQGTDSANQVLVEPRGGGGVNPVTESVNNQPVQTLPDASGNTRGNNLRDVREGAKNAN